MTPPDQHDFAPPLRQRRRRPFSLGRLAAAGVIIALPLLFLVGRLNPSPTPERVAPAAPLAVKTTEDTPAPVLSLPPSPPPVALVRPVARPTARREQSMEPFLSRQTDRRLGGALLDVLKSQNPYGAVYLMVDGPTGQILAWGEQKGFHPLPLPDMLGADGFPAASLAKIVSAAAALESGRYTVDSTIPAIGRGVTLYRRQLAVPAGYRGKRVSLRKAFASSMNPPMGIIGQELGGESLRKTAESLGFNIDFPQGIPGESRYLSPDDGFGVAEAASGFTTEITLSPLLAGAIVRTVLTGEPVEIPWSPLLGEAYAPAAPLAVSPPPFRPQTYAALQEMFEATVAEGSARRSFRNSRVFHAQNRRRLRVGGKTGTKERDDIRYEWFAGFAEDREAPGRSVVIVCLHMNEVKGKRASHPTQAAALLINHWARSYLDW